MKKTFSVIIFFFITSAFSQSINLNQEELNLRLRVLNLKGQLLSKHSLNHLPVNINKVDFLNDSIFFKNYSSKVLNFGGKGSLRILPVDINSEFTSSYPYKSNNGSMLPNKGFQSIISPGILIEYGIFSAEIKPEIFYSENKKFNGFGEGPFGHENEIWMTRYKLWNTIDMPERHGNHNHQKILFGQSSLLLTYKNLSFGLSTKNIWWGPSFRNSIMMSNNARGFTHLTFNTDRPLKTKIGNIEWQLISGKLESSGYNPIKNDVNYLGNKFFIPKINQLSETDDWRYIQAISLNFSPKWTPNIYFGFVRWAIGYSALFKKKYSWMNGNPSWFPVFNNFFRKSDKFSDIEDQIDQAAGFNFKWIWPENQSEIYFEFYYNDSKQNIRDLILDSDHSRASTIGIQKIFNLKKSEYLFRWEWTQMEQTAGRLLRNSGSWYQHGYVYDGYTNKGEILGSYIGPGSNSHFISINKLNRDKNIGVALEIIDNDNDFNYEAFQASKDFRRYWKDINLHIKYSQKIKNVLLSSKLIFIKSLNYQWELDDSKQPYYHAGNDRSNIYFNIKLNYFFKSDSNN